MSNTAMYRYDTARARLTATDSLTERRITGVIRTPREPFPLEPDPRGENLRGPWFLCGILRTCGVSPSSSLDLLHAPAMARGWLREAASRVPPLSRAEMGRLDPPGCSGTGRKVRYGRTVQSLPPFCKLEISLRLGPPRPSIAGPAKMDRRTDWGMETGAIAPKSEDADAYVYTYVCYPFDAPLGKQERTRSGRDDLARLASRVRRHGALRVRARAAGLPNSW